MRPNKPYKDPVKSIVDNGDQPVLVSADVENDSRISYGVGGPEGSPQIREVRPFCPGCSVIPRPERTILLARSISTAVAENPLYSTGGVFVPYSFRRPDPRLTTEVDGIELAFELPTEYGIWIHTGTATSGRIGRVRLKLRRKIEWLFRLVGELSWRRRFHEVDKATVLRELLRHTAVQK